MGFFSSPVVSGILGGASGLPLVGDVFGGFAQGYWNAENYQYQKDLQNRIFSREDNAVQRRMADLEKAGLSKTLAAGGAAGAGQAISPTRQQVQTGSRMSEDAMKYMQAITMDKSLSRMDEEIENLQEQNSNLQKQGHLVDAQADVAKAQANATRVKTAIDSHDLKYLRDNNISSHSSVFGRTKADVTNPVTSRLARFSERQKIINSLIKDPKFRSKSLSEQRKIVDNILKSRGY